MPHAREGWLPDPDDPTQIRFWDGRAWTHHVAAAPRPRRVEPPADPHPGTARVATSSAARWRYGAPLAAVVVLALGAVVVVERPEGAGSPGAAASAAYGAEGAQPGTEAETAAATKAAKAAKRAARKAHAAKKAARRKKQREAQAAAGR